MRTQVVVAGAAMALLLGGSIAVIARVTAEPPASAAAPAAAAAATPDAASAHAASAGAPRANPGEALVLEPPADGPRGQEFTPPAALPAPRPRARPVWLEGATQKLGPRRDPTALGPLRPYVAAGLSRLQVAVAGCADEAPPGAAAGGAARGRTALTLKLEALDNQLRIADAVAAEGGAADDWRVQCAQRKLRGQIIYAPSRVGARFELPFVLDL